MTNWEPDLATATGPRYLAIADRIAKDVAAGRLKPGDRLPPHRDLAWKLGVTVGTVTRGYTEAERRGLIGGEVGRGTYVRERAIDLPPAPPPPSRDFVDLARNFPSEDLSERTIADTVGEIAKLNTLAPLLSYAPNLGSPQHRAAGAQWVAARSGMPATAAEIAVTNGAQHGMTVALSALTRAGDVVLTEQLTFYGIKSLGKLLSLRLQGVTMDEHGLVPAALDLACRQFQPKALYCLPTLQNPTTVTMPRERREEVAAICKRHGVVIVEDDIYGFLVPDAPPPVASFAPENAVYIVSLSKCLAPGLRVGYVRAPEAMMERISAPLRGTTWMATPLMAEIAGRLIASKKAEQLALKQRDEAIARQDIARRVLAGLDIAAPPTSMHVWLRLPDPWRREEFTTVARQRGVGVAPAESFAIGRISLPHAVRLGLSAAPGRPELERALKTIAEILSDAPDIGSPMV
jgi:DNA-binding transcriptional MocR family regulator